MVVETNQCLCAIHQGNRHVLIIIWSFRQEKSIFDLIALYLPRGLKPHIAESLYDFSNVNARK